MRRLLLLTLAIFLTFTGAKLAEGTAPDFTLKTMNGDKFRLSKALEQGPVLIDFWATWCKPCVQAMPHVDEIHKKYAQRGLQVTSISIDNPKSQAKIKPFIKSRDYEFTVLLDGDMEVRKLFGGTKIPFSVLISPSGEIVYSHLGFVPGDEDKLTVEIEKLLNSLSLKNSDIETGED